MSLESNDRHHKRNQQVYRLPAELAHGAALSVKFVADFAASALAIVDFQRENQQNHVISAYGDKVKPESKHLTRIGVPQDEASEGKTQECDAREVTDRERGTQGCNVNCGELAGIDHVIRRIHSGSFTWFSLAEGFTFLTSDHREYSWLKTVHN